MMQPYMKTLELYLQENPTKGLLPFVDYMEDYKTTYQQIDQIFLNRYQNWECRRFDPPTLLLYIQNLFAVNSYKYETLAGTLNLDYNPIENYSMVESGTDVHTGTDDKTITVGEQNVTENQNLGTVQSTSTQSVAPMNTETFLNREQNQTEQAPVVNTVNQNIGMRNDKDVTGHNLSIEHNFKRSVNIGVQTS